MPESTPSEIEALKQRLALVTQERDELKLQMHLASMDARDEYDRLRYCIASLLREIYRLRADAEETGEAPDMQALQTLRFEIDRDHAQLDQQVGAILRDRHITPMMATSLLNDLNYVDETSRNLFDITQALMVTHEELITEAQSEPVLEETQTSIAR